MAPAGPVGGATSARAERARRLARLLDAAVRIPGTDIRLGLDALLGLLPVGGDVAGAILSAWIVLSAARLGAPPSVLLRMIANLAFDALVGVVPVVGDLADVGWRANLRNVRLLERHLEAPGAVARGSRWALVGVAGALVALLGMMGWGAWVTLRALVGWLAGG